MLRTVHALYMLYFNWAQTQALFLNLSSSCGQNRLKPICVQYLLRQPRFDAFYWDQIHVYYQSLELKHKRDLTSMSSFIYQHIKNSTSQVMLQVGVSADFQLSIKLCAQLREPTAREFNRN